MTTHTNRLLAILAVAAFAVACAHSRPPLAIQAKCGVSPESDVSRAQAVCIAKLGGLEPGLSQWDVHEDTASASDDARWVVSNLLDPTRCARNPGKAMYIRKKGGDILGTPYIIAHCDPL
jgi:hypothetical protein